MKNYTVSEDFILAAHKEACTEWKKKIEKEFPDIFKVEYYEEKIYIYRSFGEYYKLTRIQNEHFVWADISASNVWANGEFESAEMAIRYVSKYKIFSFDTLASFSRWIYKETNEIEWLNELKRYTNGNKKHC